MGIRLLDCTLRDGAYINNGEFGEPALRGIVKKLQDAHVDMIECGWLKNDAYLPGTSYFHLPADAEQYFAERSAECVYSAMIDWDRYDVEQLPENNGRSIDAVRIVFPCGKHKEAMETGRKIREKGYQVLFQAANTLSYSTEALKQLAADVNEFHPVSLSVVDTFGAMYFEDLDRIVTILDGCLDSDIELGFHSHNNQQLAFALCIHFVEALQGKRSVIVDSSLCGMGRGAGNATTELLVSYLNRKQHGSYDINAVMDAIDMYMQKFQEHYKWGYSTPYFIAGMYQCHVNNIAYLLTNHRTNASDMRSVIESLSVEERRKYDYDVLEQKYMENQNRAVDDEDSIRFLRDALRDRKVMLLAPGKSTVEEEIKLKEFIRKENPVVIAVNAINDAYRADFVFFTNTVRYAYAKEAYPAEFERLNKILLSNIKTEPARREYLIHYNAVIERGWEHFDNAVILCLRLMNRLKVKNIYIAGFDGFQTKYNESYADSSLPTLNPDHKWDELNLEIKEMYRELYDSLSGKMQITFLTESIFEVKQEM